MCKIHTPEVVVLMSTYNGERHLVEQIESVLNQEGVDVRLMIRDDGSNDKTVEIARKYTDDVVIGENIGYRYSFLELIKNAPEADFYALADQDDIWLPKKLITAVEMISSETRSHSHNIPILYTCRRKNYINGEIVEPTELRPFINYPFNGFNNGISVQGCTIVMNRCLKHLVGQFRPNDLQMDHDTWINQVCRAIGGKVILDNRPWLIYRIENNTVGIPRHRISNRILGLFKKQPEYAKSVGNNLLCGYSCLMPDTNIEICKKLINYKENKFSLLFDKRAYYGNFAIKVYRFFAIMTNSL